MKLLETCRLLIREFCPDDAALLCQYSQEETAKRELPDEVLRDTQHGRQMIALFQRNYPSRRYPLVYAVALKANGLMIGHISLSAIPEGVEIGYAIAMADQGKGYAQEMVAPFSQWAIQQLCLDRLYGLVKHTNTASCRVLEQSGYQFLREETRRAWGGAVPFRVYCRQGHHFRADHPKGIAE